MTKPPKDQKPKDSPSQYGTIPGALYDRHGPIPVPEAHEADSESVWALFQEPAKQDTPQQEEIHPSFADTTLQDFPFGDTERAPLKP